MMLLALAALIPPPPGWTPPRASGPGTFCGTSFTLDLERGEGLAADWPGEVFINDIYGTYRVTTAAGTVVVSEDGRRTRPTGASRPTGVERFRAVGATIYSRTTAPTSTIRAVTVRFPAGTSRREAQPLLRRIRFATTDATRCLRPENR